MQSTLIIYYNAVFEDGGVDFRHQHPCKCNSLERQYFALELSIEMHLTLEPLTKYSWGCLLRFLLERVSKYWPHQYKHKQYNNFDFAVKV